MLKPVLLAALLALSAALPATVHFVNKGVKYHLGDGRFDRSTDSDFLDTYPVVGEEWIQAFTVTADDVIKVSIEEVWGIDDCPYCKIMVDIDGREMGRLFEEDNHKSFNTPGPLALRVKAGQVYQLRVSTRGEAGKADDMAFQGVSIETDKAAIIFYEPGPVIRRSGQPVPVFRAPQPVQGPCEGVNLVKGWLPQQDQGRGVSEFKPTAGPVRRQAAAALAEGDFVRLYAKHTESASGDAVGQYLELLVGDPATGWVLSFGAGSLRPSYGNLKSAGRYGAESFAVNGWKEGAWNELRLARCPDGLTRLWINGVEQRARFQGLPAGPLAWSLRSAGLGLQISEKAF